MNLKHPETGQHARASIKTAERLIEEGWELIEDAILASPAPAPAPAASAPAADDTGSGQGAAASDAGNGGSGAPEFDESSKLADLVKFAEEHQLFDADKLEAWRKPGTKKADVASAIKTALEQKHAEVQGQ